jgi:hypothetical protein
MSSGALAITLQVLGSTKHLDLVEITTNEGIFVLLCRLKMINTHVNIKW